MIGETEGDVVGQGIVLEQQLQRAASRRTVDEIRTAPAEDMVRALGEHGVIAHVLHRAGQRVVVDELRIAEHAGPDPEQRLDALVVQRDLLPEFLR